MTHEVVEGHEIAVAEKFDGAPGDAAVSFVAVQLALRGFPCATNPMSALLASL
jgi:hypothetical protein